MKRFGYLTKEVQVIVATEPADFEVYDAKTTLFIIDEADHLYFDLLAYPKQGKVLGLTATSIGCTDKAELELLLYGNKMQILEAGFDKLDENEVITVNSVHEFMHLTNGMPRLVYGRSALEGELQGCHEKNVTQYATITNLRATQTLLQTEPWMMRGLDYSTEHHTGIALLIARPCSSRRAYI